jgi:hypothetical protein
MNALAIHRDQTNAGRRTGARSFGRDRHMPAHWQGLRHEVQFGHAASFYRRFDDPTMARAASPAASAQFSFPRHIDAGFLLPPVVAEHILLPCIAGTCARGFDLGRSSIRAGRCTRRPFVLRPLDHLGCNRSDPAKCHVVPSFVSASDENHHGAKHVGKDQFPVGVLQNVEC